MSGRSKTASDEAPGGFLLRIIMGGWCIYLSVKCRFKISRKTTRPPRLNFANLLSCFERRKSINTSIIKEASKVPRGCYGTVKTVCLKSSSRTFKIFLKSFSTSGENDELHRLAHRSTVKAKMKLRLQVIFSSTMRGFSFKIVHFLNDVSR